MAARIIRPLRTRRGRLYAIALVISALSLAGACGSAGDDAGSTDSGSESRFAGVELAEPTRRPRFTLTDTSGAPFDFYERTRGTLTFLYFGYTYCPDICPVHMAQLADVLDEPGAPDATVVFVSVDPGRDAPERIRNWLGKFSDDFIGLTGSTEELDAAQRAAGVPLAVVEDDAENPAVTGDVPDYVVGHAGQVLAYAPDDRGYTVYPFGTRQSQYASDARILAEIGADQEESS